MRRQVASVHHHFDRIAFACRNHNVKARSNAALSRAVGGKGIIVSSGARSVWEMRAPHDVMNLATLFGLNQQQAKVHTALHPVCLLGYVWQSVRQGNVLRPLEGLEEALLLDRMSCGAMCMHVAAS